MSGGPAARRLRAPVAALLALVGALLVVGGSAPAARAHASVVGTSPANGAEVSVRPTSVRVTFDEPVTLAGGLAGASVLDGSGARVDVGRPRLDAARRTLTIPLERGLPRGAYIASWSVVSADTHPVGGSIEFGYGTPAATSASPAPTGPSPTLTLVVGLAKGVLYLALVLAFGLLPAARVLGVGVASRTVRRVVVAGLAGALLASVGQLVAQYAWTASSAGPVDGAVLGSALAGFAGSAYAVRVWVRLVLLGLALVLVTRRAGTGLAGTALPGTGPAEGSRSVTVREGAVAVLGLGVVVTVVLDGHGGTGGWRLVCTTAHAAAAVAWLGGLVVLGWLVLRRRLSADRLARLGAWSAYAGVAAAVLVASGTVQAIVAVRYPAALVTTPYGLVLLAKLALVAAALGLAVAGRRWVAVQRRFVRPEPGRTARLRVRTRWEAGALVGVVLLSGVLSSVPPAESAYAPTATRHTTVGPYAVTFEAGPVRRGPTSFRVTVLPPSEAAPMPTVLELTLAQPGGPVTGLAVRFPYRVPGALAPGRPTPVTFTSETVTVPSTGAWTATLTVGADRLDQYTTVVDLAFL
ncbi:MAG TPA: copper resistance protein CopC [Luteimicrobium sp.]|nr:copper resistance protein CopC [Luteimicrobium sp.]